MISGARADDRRPAVPAHAGQSARGHRRWRSLLWAPRTRPAAAPGFSRSAASPRSYRYTGMPNSSPALPEPPRHLGRLPSSRPDGHKRHTSVAPMRGCSPDAGSYRSTRQPCGRPKRCLLNGFGTPTNVSTERLRPGSEVQRRRLARCGRHRHLPDHPEPAALAKSECTRPGVSRRRLLANSGHITNGQRGGL